MNKAIAIAALLSVTMTLGACRDGEQDRFRIYEQGVYKGKPDQQLGLDNYQTLRNRTVEQADGTMGAGAIGKMTGDARPPQ